MEKNKQFVDRVWLKCKNCGCTWYDDGNNTFSGCPECGNDFYIFNEEKIDITKKGKNTCMNIK